MCDTEAEAIAAWNTRPAPTPADALAEAWKEWALAMYDRLNTEPETPEFWAAIERVRVARANPILDADLAAYKSSHGHGEARKEGERG